MSIVDTATAWDVLHLIQSCGRGTEQGKKRTKLPVIGSWLPRLPVNLHRNSSWSFQFLLHVWELWGRSGQPAIHSLLPIIPTFLEALLLQQLHQILLNGWDGVGLGRVSGHWIAIAVNQEFSEIPLDEVAEHPTLFGLQEFPKRMSFTTVHLHFGEHVKLYPITLGKLLDLRLCAGFLASKLIAGEGQDAEALRLILLVKLHQFGVVHVSLASLTGYIDDNTHTASVLFHGHIIAIYVHSTELIEGRTGCHD